MMINLEMYRKEKNFSVYKLHKLTGISRSYLSEIEKGKSDPTASKILILCLVLDITPNDLLNWNTVTKK